MGIQGDLKGYELVFDALVSIRNFSKNYVKFQISKQGFAK